MSDTTRSSSVRSAAAGLGAVTTAALLASAALAHAPIKPRTSGVYQSTRTATGRTVFFNVVKKRRRRRVADFEIFCSTAHKDGAVYDSSSVSISAAGRFSYRGSAAEYQGGVKVGKATLRFSGRFLSATKARGAASFTKPTVRLGGCPAHSFTAYWRQQTGD